MRTRVFNSKEQIFCEWRHRWVRLTPEEWVRQQLLHRLVEQLGFPASLIAVEQAITVGTTKKRCDAVVYD
ncbi:MAG: type I restriction enzyme HsdR N-terminal domain-containing protein, partial [Paludibacteraceae bacterium]|nr:type I restriction enzyme HsdR N-terminal domain-containing protein [Paludibacteraceae bacterium]